MNFKQFVEDKKKEPERYIYIGVVTDNNAVIAQKFAYFKDSEKYGETPVHSWLGDDAHGERWRYVIGSNTIFWWDKPTQDQEYAVNSYLFKRGFKAELKHLLLYDEPKFDKEYEYAHGHFPLPKKYKLTKPANMTTAQFNFLRGESVMEEEQHPHPSVLEKVRRMGYSKARKWLKSFGLTKSEQTEILRKAMKGPVEEAYRNPNEDEPFKQRLGRCYELAGRFASSNEGCKLIHGSIQGFNNPRIKHAWVELPDGEIWEPATNQTWAKDAFERFFNAIPEKEYDTERTHISMLRNKHWGPWGESVLKEDSRTLYHVAPTEARSSIRKYGIDATKSLYDRSENSEGFYAFVDLNEARWYAEYMANYDPRSKMDIWKVTTKHKVTGDPGLSSNDEMETTAVYHSIPIGAKQVKLICTITPH